MTPRRFCAAKKKQGEGSCTRGAGWGTDHPGSGRCKLHGGRTPSGRAAAAKQQVQQQAAAELARLNVAPVEDPLSELAALAGQVVAWKDQMAGKVNALTSLRYEGGIGTEQLRSEVALFERAMDRCMAALTAMARLNIDERLARITEAQQELVLAALAHGLSEVLHLSADEQRAVREAVVAYLRRGR